MLKRNWKDFLGRDESVAPKLASLALSVVVAPALKSLLFKAEDISVGFYDSYES